MGVTSVIDSRLRIPRERTTASKRAPSISYISSRRNAEKKKGGCRVNREGQEEARRSEGIDKETTIESPEEAINSELCSAAGNVPNFP